MTTRKPDQLPFDLAHEAAYTRADFHVSSCNAEAMAWIDKWPAWPAPVLVVHGPPGCGKTHLARIWAQASGAAPVENPAQIAQARAVPRACLVDGVEACIGSGEKEKALFHLYNTLRETGGHMLVTAERPPGEWAFVVPDLKSRLVAAPAVCVQPPDDGLLSVVLAKMFSDRQIFVPQEVIAFILPRMERSFAAARALAERIDKKALAEKRAVTVPLVRDLLQEKDLS